MMAQGQLRLVYAALIIAIIIKIIRTWRMIYILTGKTLCQHHQTVAEQQQQQHVEQQGRLFPQHPEERQQEEQPQVRSKFPLHHIFFNYSIAARPRSCPRDFENISNNCYLISTERVGWIEAKKKCEIKGARLISLEFKEKQEDLVEYVSSITNRRRGKYWTGGNDIHKEGVWVWEGVGGEVPDYGWAEDPYNSPEENCLSWSVTFGYNVGDSDSNWHGASCCNSQRYICEV